MVNAIVPAQTRTQPSTKKFAGMTKLSHPSLMCRPRSRRWALACIGGVRWLKPYGFIEHLFRHDPTGWQIWLEVERPYRTKVKFYCFPFFLRRRHRSQLVRICDWIYEHDRDMRSQIAEIIWSGQALIRRIEDDRNERQRPKEDSRRTENPPSPFRNFEPGPSDPSREEIIQGVRPIDLFTTTRFLEDLRDTVWFNYDCIAMPKKHVGGKAAIQATVDASGRVSRVELWDPLAFERAQVFLNRHIPKASGYKVNSTVDQFMARAAVAGWFVRDDALSQLLIGAIAEASARTNASEGYSRVFWSEARDILELIGREEFELKSTK